MAKQKYLEYCLRMNAQEAKDLRYVFECFKYYNLTRRAYRIMYKLAPVMLTLPKPRKRNANRAN